MLGFACGLAPSVLQVGLPDPPAPVAPNDGQLRVLTLNLAHGRGTRLNQLLVSEAGHRNNLVTVADLLSRAAPHVVALQEADGPSLWSGGFDHVETLARRAGFDWYFRGDHAQSWLFRYGTALLSRLPLANSFSHSFEPTPPTPRKGFVLSELRWPSARQTAAPGAGPDVDPAARIDLVSVHLDYRSSAARQRQLDALTRVLTHRNRPTIVLGDFNLGWQDGTSALARMAGETGLTGYLPQQTGFATHAGTRIDWVLISGELQFARYAVLPDRVSDHHAVLADIEFKSSVPPRAGS